MKITINHVLLLVLVYPLLLFLPSLFAKEAFFITAPYFFTIFLLILGWIAYKIKAFNFNKTDVVTFSYLLLITCSIVNFSSLRYSLPIFFTIYSCAFYIFLNRLNDKTINFKLITYYFLLILLLTIPMIFLNSGYTKADRFVGFIGSPTIYSGFLVSFFIITSYSVKTRSFKFIIFFIITFYLVYLTKTRLLLIIMVLYPLLRLLAKKKSWASRKLIFLVFYIFTLMIYPMYSIITGLFPSLVTLRYGKKEDSSFGLRNYLFEEMKELFLSGNVLEKISGKGNEFSRLYVEKLMGFDLMPHNDYMRILIDWGIIGFVVFSYVLYKIAIKNDLCLYLSLVYMVLFYSNTIFNLFLISMLLIFYHNTNNTKRHLDFEKEFR